MKTAHKRRMDEVRVKVSVKECFVKKFVMSRLRWAGYLENMGDKKNLQRVEIKRRR